jgi:hypothetical protein
LAGKKKIREHEVTLDWPGWSGSTSASPERLFSSVGIDGIPGVVPGLVPGIQGFKTPGSLGKTWDQAKSLKFILIDSNFLLSPVLRPPVTLGCSPVFSKNFSFFKRYFTKNTLQDFPGVREM